MNSYKQSLTRRPILKLAIALWLLFASSGVQAVSQQAVNTISMGGGISFGMLGYSYDRKLTDKLELRLASGIPLWSGGWPYNVGVRYYFKNEGRWHTRVSLMYGTVGMENFSDDPHAGEAYNNYAVGVGQTFVFNRTGKLSYTVDMDLVFSEFPDAYFEDRDSAPAQKVIDSRDEPLRLAIGFGIRF